MRSGVAGCFEADRRINEPQVAECRRRCSNSATWPLGRLATSALLDQPQRDGVAVARAFVGFDSGDNLKDHARHAKRESANPAKRASDHKGDDGSLVSSMTESMGADNSLVKVTLAAEAGTAERHGRVHGVVATAPHRSFY